MKQLLKRLLALGLSTVIACAGLPAAFATDTEPPLYEQFGYTSADEMMTYEGFYQFDYDMVVDRYLAHYDEITANPQIALDYWYMEDLEDLDSQIAGGNWASREECYREVALLLTREEEDGYVPPLSVQVNGEKIAFPDAQPEEADGRVMVPVRAIAEALDAKVYLAENGNVYVEKDAWSVSFAVGSTQLNWDGPVGEEPAGFVDPSTHGDGAFGDTSLYCQTMDVAPYERDGRTYVSARWLAAALGMTVEWDEDIQQVVLYDAKALAALLDERFTVVNQWLAMQPKNDPAQATETAVGLALAYTMLNSIDGDQTATVTGKVNVVTENDNFTLNASCDLYTLLAMIGKNADGGWGMADEWVATVEKYKPQLQNATFEMIWNVEDNAMYLRSSLLPVLMQEAQGKIAEAIAAGTWIKFSDVLGETEMDAIDTVQAVQQAAGTTVGTLLVAQEGMWYGYASDIWAGAQTNADETAKLIGDDLFTHAGDRYTAKTQQNTEDEYGATNASLTLMLDMADGSFSCDLSRRSKRSYISDSLVTLSASGDAKDCTVALVNHVKNKSITKLDMHITQKAAPAAPLREPPAGSLVLDWDNLFSYEP